MPYASLRDFMDRLEKAGRLVRVKAPVSSHLEMTEIQTRLLAEQKIDVDAGLLIVETRTDDIFVVVKLEPSQPATRDRYAAQLGRLACRPLKT